MTNRKSGFRINFFFFILCPEREKQNITRATWFESLVEVMALWILQIKHIPVRWLNTKHVCFTNKKIFFGARSTIERSGYAFFSSNPIEPFKISNLRLRFFSPDIIWINALEPNINRTVDDKYNNRTIRKNKKSIQSTFFILIFYGKMKLYFVDDSHFQSTKCKNKKIEIFMFFLFSLSKLIIWYQKQQMPNSIILFWFK